MCITRIGIVDLVDDTKYLVLVLDEGSLNDLTGLDPVLTISRDLELLGGQAIALR